MAEPRVTKKFNNGKSMFTKKKKDAVPKAVKKYVKKELKEEVEMKFFVKALPFSGIPIPAGLIFDLTTVPQNISDSGRIGDCIDIKYIRIRLSLLVGQPISYIRMIMFQWCPQDASLPPTDVQILLPGLLGANVDYWSEYNRDREQDYKIITDKSFQLVGDALLATTPNTTSSGQFINKTFKPRMAKVKFTAATTNGTNKVYLLFVSGGGPPFPSVGGLTTIFYTDA